MTIELSKADELINDIICEDMGTIWWEVGGQDGMYESFPIVRIYREGKYTRCYALDSNGGVAIISPNGTGRDFQILTLGEDDANHFLNGACVYERYWGGKTGFVHLVSEALSIFNNNVRDDE